MLNSRPTSSHLFLVVVLLICDMISSRILAVKFQVGRAWKNSYILMRHLQHSTLEEGEEIVVVVVLRGIDVTRKAHKNRVFIINPLSATSMQDKISQAIDNNEYSIGIFLDLSKAFDTVDHNILIQKLERYGIRGT